MISPDVYEALREEFGTRASWAIWTMPDKGPKSNTADLSLFSLPDIADKLSNDFVIIALNRAVHAPGKVADWSNFHSGDNRRQNDYKLRHALYGTPLWGSYITDILEVEETDSAKVMRKVRQEPEWVSQNVERLRHELSLLGGLPKLVALGNDTERILRRHFEDYEIFKIPHFASRAANNKDDYRGIVARELSLK